QAGTNTTTIHALHDTGRDAERNIGPLVPLLFLAKEEHTRFIAKQAPNRRRRESPHLRKLLHAVVTLSWRHALNHASFKPLSAVQNCQLFPAWYWLISGLA